MKPYHKNPRQITEKQFDNLNQTLDELGDLSGIVHDLNSDEVIGGNQRGRVFDIFSGDCEIVIETELDEPDRQGTVAFGYVLWNNARYQYRQVRWTPEQCEQANIVANKAGGNWDFDILANEFEMDDLLEWGFEEWEIGLGYGESQPPPSLDELEGENGDHQERDFWPVIRVQVSPKTMELYQSFMDQIESEDEAIKFERLMGAVDATVLGFEPSMA